MDTVTERPESEEAPAAEVAEASRAEERDGEIGAPAGEREPPPRPERKRRGRYTPRRKVCAFCVDHVEAIDYKDPSKLRRYLSDRGKMEPRRKTGTCAKHQRRLTIALKRARHLALLPYTAEHIRLTGAFASRT
jgi:small subunit ribosomal protein S18